MKEEEKEARELVERIKKLGLNDATIGEMVDEIERLRAKTDGGATVPCSDGLVAKLIEVDSLIRCVHLDMGGNDKYHISPRHNDQIGKLIKECLYIAEGN